MTTPSDPSDPNAPYGQQDPNAPTEQFPPYPPYPQYPPAYPGAAPAQPYGQSPYDQSTYGQSPYGPPPGYPAYPAYPGYPPPMPRQRSNRTLWIVLSVVGGVLLLACISCVVLGVVISNNLVHNPVFGSAITATEFCSYEQQQDYTSAYNLFSSNLQSQMTQDEFVSDAQQLDTENGTVSDCTATPDSSDVGDTSATYQVTVTRGAGSAATTSDGSITLVNTDGNWQVDSIDQSLGLM